MGGPSPIILCQCKFNEYYLKITDSSTGLPVNSMKHILYFISAVSVHFNRPLVSRLVIQCETLCKILIDLVQSCRRFY